MKTLVIVERPNQYNRDLMIKVYEPSEIVFDTRTVVRLSRHVHVHDTSVSYTEFSLINGEVHIWDRYWTPDVDPFYPLKLEMLRVIL